MTKRLWQLHSWLGLIAGLGLLVIGMTGSLLVFREELESLVNPKFIRVEPAATGRLPLDTLLTSVNQALPEYEVTGWLVRHEERELADVIYVIGHGTDEWQVATLDPYTGNLLASPRKGTDTLSGWLLELHYAFFADHTGVFIAGLLAVMLCLLGVSGLWLYRDFWRNFFRLRWRASARIFLSDLHKTVGISSVVFNLILGFTGAYWNLTHVIGEWIQGEHEHAKMSGRLYGEALSLDAVMKDAATQLAGFRGNFISLPSEPEAGVTLWGSATPDNPFRSPYGSTVMFDAQTGAFKAANDIRAAGWWMQFTDMFRPLHYGTFGGLPVKILWSLGGLTPGILAVSGFLIWRKRRVARSRVDEDAAV